MGIESIGFGESVAGLLVDGVVDTLYTGATLKLERGRGVVVEIPFIVLCRRTSVTVLPQHIGDTMAGFGGDTSRNPIIRPNSAARAKNDG